MNSHNNLVEVVNTFPSRDGKDLHLRYIGYADGRPFIVNIQFDHSEPGLVDSEIESSKLATVLMKIFGLIVRRILKEPALSLH